MKILIIGPQGSGKSTQAELLSKKLGIFYLSTGNISRKIARENTPLGRKVKKIMESGRLVDDQTILQVVEKVLQGKKNFVAEGFPRNLFQAKKFKKGFNKVFYLKISQKEIIRRLTARRICQNCKANFNLITTPPKKERVCDFCGGELIQREDDSKEAIKKRLEIYQKATKPLLDFYRQKGIFQEVDGERPIEVIFKDILSRV